MLLTIGQVRAYPTAQPYSSAYYTGSAQAGRITTVAGDWQETTVPDLTTAEDVLDTLASQGFAERTFAVEDGERFVVRWK